MALVKKYTLNAFSYSIYLSALFQTHCKATMADESWSWEAEWVPPENPEEGILAIGNRDSAFFKDR